MSRRVMMIGRDTEQFSQISRLLEKEGFDVSRSRNFPERIIGKMDLMFISYSDIPQNGDGLPQGVPVLGYRYKGQSTRKHLSNVEILCEQDQSDETVLQRIWTKIGEAEHARQMKLVYRDLSVDLINMRVTVGGEKISLSTTEFKILSYLMEHLGEVLSREQILKHVWGDDTEADSKMVEVYISHLREKIDDFYEKTYISTIRGKGYVIGRDLRRQY